MELKQVYILECIHPNLCRVLMAKAFSDIIEAKHYFWANYGDGYEWILSEIKNEDRQIVATDDGIDTLWYEGEEFKY